MLGLDWPKPNLLSCPGQLRSLHHLPLPALRLPAAPPTVRSPPPLISHHTRSMASSSKLRHAVRVSNTGAPAGLPADALFEVLLRLPDKDLSRLRVVCRSWRALTYDPHFATVHKSRHAEPLFAFTFRDSDDRGIAIVSLSGQMLRRIPFGSDCIELLLTNLDRLCVIRNCKPSLATWVLNPAIAVALSLPGPCSDEFVGICTEHRFNWGYALSHNCKTVTYAFGQVASTGSYKVLRINHPDRSQSLLCDIVTLDGSCQGRWRRKENPPSNLMRPCHPGTI